MTFKERLIFFGRHVVFHERNNRVRHGEVQRFKKLGTAKAIRRIKLFRRIGFLGLLLFYLESVLGSRNRRYKTWGKKTVVIDHNSKTIENSSIKVGSIMLDSYVECRIRIPLTFYLAPSFLSSCIMVFNKTKPDSIFEYNSLMSFYLNVLFAKYLFEERKIKSVLMVDDFSPKRIAFAMASNEAGLKIGVIRMSDEINRARPFFPFHYLFCWSSHQVNEMKDEEITIAQFKVRRTELKLDQLTSLKDLHIGIGLNAITEEHNLKSILELLRLNGHSGTIRLRPHPNVDISKWEVLNEYSNLLVPKTESLDYFASQLDVAVTGISSIIPKVLLLGVPVLYSKYLDSEHYNPPSNTSYKFVEDGEVYPLESEKIDLNEVKSFYSNPLWIANQDAKTKISPDSVDVGVALQELLNG